MKRALGLLLGKWSTAFTDSSTTCTYTKVGRMVTVEDALRINSVSGGTAGTSVSIGGLPFTVI